MNPHHFSVLSGKRPAFPFGPSPPLPSHFTCAPCPRLLRRRSLLRLQSLRNLTSRFRRPLLTTGSLLLPCHPRSQAHQPWMKRHSGNASPRDRGTSPRERHPARSSGRRRQEEEQITTTPHSYSSKRSTTATSPRSSNTNLYTREKSCDARTTSTDSPSREKSARQVSAFCAGAGAKAYTVRHDLPCTADSRSRTPSTGHSRTFKLATAARSRNYPRH